MNTDITIQLGNMVTCLSDAVDLISRKVARHHKRVAMLGRSIAAEMGIGPSAVNNVLLAGLVHDVGALTLRERLDLMRFEEAPGDMHSERGYLLLGIFEPFSRIAEIVRYHHLPWAYTDKTVPIESHIIHLADRIAVQIADDREVLSQADVIRAAISMHTPSRFAPGPVEAFMMASLRDEFWMDVMSLDIDARLARLVEPVNVVLDRESVLGLAAMFGVVVDFRSRFTAVHTAGVSSVAGALGRLMGMDDPSLWKMQVAGNLHDLGKLAIPIEIINKPGKLDKDEFDLMKRHTYYTHSLLSRLPGMEEINDWASYHHERLDGKGYPFHKEAGELPLGSRIMSVADVFTALSEDRPYRPGMDPAMTFRIMDWMTDNGALDRHVLEALKDNMEDVGAERSLAQETARIMYEDFRNMGRMAA